MNYTKAHNILWNQIQVNAFISESTQKKIKQNSLFIENTIIMIKYRIFWDQEFNFHFILDQSIYNKKKKAKILSKSNLLKR